MYGKRTFCYVAISKGKRGLSAKITSASISTLKKENEKSFGCATWIS